MDISALPYFFAVIADCLVIMIFGFIKYVRWKKREPMRPVVLAFLVWLICNLVRTMLIVLSAGPSAMFGRDAVIWAIRWAVVAEHAVLLAIGGLFFAENTTFVHVLSVQDKGNQ